MTESKQHKRHSIKTPDSETYQQANEMVRHLLSQLKEILPPEHYKVCDEELKLVLRGMQKACETKDCVQAKAIFIYLRGYKPAFIPTQNTNLAKAKAKAITALRVFHRKILQKFQQELDPTQFYELKTKIDCIAVEAEEIYHSNNPNALLLLAEFMEHMFQIAVKEMQVVQENNKKMHL